MSRFARFSVAIYSMLVLLFGAIAASPFLAEAQGGAGVRLSPALIEETLEPGTTKQYEVSIANQNPNEETFFLSLRNIEGVRDGGAPIFSDENREITGYELIDWITLEQTAVTLPAGAEVTVPFTISLPADAPPGSRFGGIFVSVNPPEIERSGAAVGFQVANIISIRVAGDANESANIRQFATDNYFHGGREVNFSARVENTGNVLIRPVGPVEISNMFGQQVAAITINEARSAVFPGATRDFSLLWTSDTTRFGRYEARVSLAYGEQGAIRTMTSTASFWVLPLNILGPALGALAFLLLISYIAVKLYVRRTLARMGYAGRGQSIRRRRSGGSVTVLLFTVLLTVTALFLLLLLVLFA